MTDSHTQIRTIKVMEFYPEHSPRENDPHYHIFNSARARLERLGKLKCWINNKDCHGGIELHHSLVEFSLTNGVDIHRFEELYPEFNIIDDESFLNFVEGEGNLLPLCMFHHRSSGGIHSLPYPCWIAQRFWKSDLPSPGISIKNT